MAGIGCQVNIPAGNSIRPRGITKLERRTEISGLLISNKSDYLTANPTYVMNLLKKQSEEYIQFIPHS